MLVAAGLAALIVAAPQAFADFSLTDWRYVKPVSLPAELRREGLVEVAPDREVFAGAASGLVDLRIIADDGTEAPYKLEVSRGERQRVSIPVAIRDKGYVRGQYTTATGELTQEGALHNEIEILTPAANFLRNVTVEASDDGVTWATIAEQEIYDLTVREPGFTTRDTRVKYPESTARYLRLRIADDAEGPVEVSGASVFFVKETPAREVSWPASISSISQDTDRRTTLVDVDLGTRGLPSHRLVIEASEVNFYREVDLQTSADGVQWRPSGSASLTTRQNSSGATSLLLTPRAPLASFASSSSTKTTLPSMSRGSKCTASGAPWFSRRIRAGPTAFTMGTQRREGLRTTSSGSFPIWQQKGCRRPGLALRRITPSLSRSCRLRSPSASASHGSSPPSWL